MKSIFTFENYLLLLAPCYLALIAWSIPAWFRRNRHVDEFLKIHGTLSETLTKLKELGDRCIHQSPDVLISEINKWGDSCRWTTPLRPSSGPNIVRFEFNVGVFDSFPIVVKATITGDNSFNAQRMKIECLGFRQRICLYTDSREGVSWKLYTLGFKFWDHRQIAYAVRQMFAELSGSQGGPPGPEHEREPQGRVLSVPGSQASILGGPPILRTAGNT
jgi:hypothetical protein